MTNPEQATEPEQITAERIADLASFLIQASYDPDALSYRSGEKAFRAHLRRLGELRGPDNLLTSFYINPRNELRLGIFARYDPHAPPEEPQVDPVEAAKLMTQDTVEIAVCDPEGEPAHPPEAQS